ncbi:hypothetical protein BC830DRAFT_1163501 [Chytriomyces sp. MP71]|nr:hypothetical protein BC830DRAFT_1163501 [Chytriomyces sp. MP71]
MTENGPPEPPRSVQHSSSLGGDRNARQRTSHSPGRVPLSAPTRSPPQASGHFGIGHMQGHSTHKVAVSHSAPVMVHSPAKTPASDANSNQNQHQTHSAGHQIRKPTRQLSVMSAQPDRFLQLGDEIVLHSEKKAVLIADGQVKKRAFVLDSWYPRSAQCGDLLKAVFRIEPQFAYREAKAYRQVTETKMDDDLFYNNLLERPAIARDGEDTSHVEALKQAAILESHNNEVDFMRLKGQIGSCLLFELKVRLTSIAVTYGTVVQLFNLHTQRYLAINSRETCFNEPTAMPIEMERNLRRECLFRILPKFRIRADGEPVRCGDVIVFKSVATEAHLSTGKFRIPNDSAMLSLFPNSQELGPSTIPDLVIREASASMSQHGWTMKLFRTAQTANFHPSFQPAFSSSSAKDQQQAATTTVAGVVLPNSALQSNVGGVPVTANRLIQGGKFIRFYHKEKSGYLSCPSLLSMAGSTFEAGGLDEQKVQLMDYQFDPLNPTDTTSALSMWQVENATDAYNGEAIEWGTRVRLLHSASNMYLSVRAQYDFSLDGGETVNLLVDLTPMPGKSPRADMDQRADGTLEAEEGDPTVFCFGQVNAGAGDGISAGAYARIQHVATGAFLHPVNKNRKGAMGMSVHGNGTRVLKSKALKGHSEFGNEANNFSFFLVGSFESRMDDYFAISVVDPQLVHKFNFVQSFVPWMMKFVTQSRLNADMKGDMYPIQKGEDRALRMILTSLIFFCSKSSNMDPLKREGTPILLHQTLLRETSIVDILMKFLNFPFSVDDRLQLQIALFELGCGNEVAISGDLVHEEPSIKVTAYDELSPPISPPSLNAESGFRMPRPSRKTSAKKSPVDGMLIRSYSIRSDRNKEQIDVVIKLKDIKEGRQPMLARLFKYIYRVLKQFLLGSEHSNQSHLANKFMIISEHIDLQVGAADTLMQLIDGNPLIVKKITDGQIESFIKLLARDQNPSYVNFLIAMCFCDGVAMPAHQLTIAKMLLGRSEDFWGEEDESDIPSHIFRTRITEDRTLEILPATKVEQRKWVPLEMLCLKHTRVSSGASPNAPRRQTFGLNKRSSTPSMRSVPTVNVVPDCIEDRAAVAEYFEATLRLYRALCLGQNSEVIELMTVTWGIITLPECHIGMCDENLPDPIRGLYGDLIRVADYVFPIRDIEKYPSFEVLLQDTDIDEESQNAQILFSISKWIVSDFLSAHLSQYAQKTTTNHMILSILRLTRTLVQFGYFRDETSIKELFRVLMLILDSNTDYRDEDMALFNSFTREKSTWWTSERFEFNEFSQPILHTKIEICMVMEQLLQLRLEMRCYLMLHYWYQYSKSGGKREQIIESKRNLKVDLAFGSTNIQTLLSNIMDQTAYFRLRDILTPILLELLRFESPKLKQCSVKLLHRLYSSIEEVMDVTKAAVILNDKAHIQTYFWIQSKMKLFTNNGVGNSTFNENAKNVILGGIRFDVAADMKHLLNDFASLCVLGSKTTGDGSKQNDKVVKAVGLDHSKLTPDSITQAILCNNGIHTWVIAMLKNRLAHSVAATIRKLELAQTGRIVTFSASGSMDSRGSSDIDNEDYSAERSASGHESLDVLQSNERMRSLQSDLIVAAFEFLYRFVDGNKQHQSIIFEHIDMLIEVTNPRLSGGSPVASATCVKLLGYIFAQSNEICQKVSEHHVSLILDLSHGVKPEYIRLVKSLLKVKNKIIKKNQGIIMKQLLEHKKTYLDMNSLLSRFKVDLVEDLKSSNTDQDALDFEMEEVESRSRVSEVLRLSSKKGASSGSGPKAPLFVNTTIREEPSQSNADQVTMEYFEEVILLLAECCEGKNYMMQLMCQNVLSVQEIFSLLNSEHSSLRLKNSLACLLVCAYIEATGEEDNEKHPERIQKDNRAWKFLEYATCQVSKVLDMSRKKEGLDPDLDAFFFGGILRFVKGFFLFCQTHPSPDRPEAEDFAEILIDELTELAGFYRFTNKNKADSIISTFHSIVDAGFHGSRVDGLEYEDWVHGEDNQNMLKFGASYEHTSAYFSAENVFAVNLVLKEVLQKMGDDAAVKTMKRKEFLTLAAQFTLPTEKRLHPTDRDKACAPTKSIIQYLEQSANGISIQTVALLKRRHKRTKPKAAAENKDEIKYDIKTLQILETLVTEQIERVKAIDRTKHLEKWTKAENAKVALQCLLNELGCTLMAERLLTSDRAGVFSASMRVLIVLLDGGNKDVQNTLESYWLGTREERFFYCIHEAIKKSTVKVQELRHQADNLSSNERIRDNQSQGSASINGDSIPPSVSYTKSMASESDSRSVAGSGGAQDGEYSAIRSVMRLLQLLVEGHNFRIQEYMRVQPDNIKTFNLIKDVVEFLQAIVSFDTPQVVPVMIQVFDTLTDLSQGCTANQVTIFKAKIVQAVNFILLQQYGNCAVEKMMELKRKAVLCLSSLLEDDTDEDTRAVFKQMASTFDIRSLLVNLDSAYEIVSAQEKEKARKLKDEMGNLSKREVIMAGMHHMMKITQATSQIVVAEAIDNWKGKMFQLFTEKGSEHGSEGTELLVPDLETSQFAGSSAKFSTGSGTADTLEPVHISSFAESFALDEADVRHDLDDVDEEKEGDLAAKESGFVYAMLMATLLPYMSAENRDLCERNGAFDSFNKKTGHIEIVRELNNTSEKRLYTVLFPIPDICFHLRNYTKERFLWSRKRDTPQDKIEDFVNQSQDIIYEIRNQSLVEENIWLKKLADGHSYWWWGAYILTLLINVGNMMCMVAPTGDTEHDDFSKCPAFVDHGRTVLGLIQIVFWILSSSEFMVTQLPLLVNRRRIQNLVDDNARIKKEKEQRAWTGGDPVELKSVQELQSMELTPVDIFRGFFHEPKAIYHATMVFLAVLGLQFPSLYAIHLLDFMYRDAVLQGVIASVTMNWSSLSKTVILGVIIIYIYSVIGFVFFRHAFDENEGLHCHSLLSCFLTVLSYGLRSGGGIGELLEVPVNQNKEFYGARIILDLSFFLIVIVFLLNVVFGESLAKNDLSFFPINRAIALKNWEEADNMAQKMVDIETTVQTAIEGINVLKTQMQVQLDTSERDAAASRQGGERRKSLSRMNLFVGTALAAAKVSRSKTSYKRSE